MPYSTLVLIATDYAQFFIEFMGFWIVFFWIKRVIFD